MSKLFFLTILLSQLNLLFSQNKYANIWRFGFCNGIDFNNDTIKSETNPYIKLDESSSSICDKNGNLLFYSNGITLYNKYNKIVENGTNLGFQFAQNETTSKMGTLLLSHFDNNDSIVYLFSTDYEGNSGGLVYSKILVHGNNDSGEVILKKIKLTSNVNESITATLHQNGRDIWIVCHSFGGNTFYSILLTKNGVQNCVTNSIIGVSHSNSLSDAQVPLKFSPNGKYIAQNCFSQQSTEILNFNNSNGKIESSVFENNFYYSYLFEFSPNSNYIYIDQSDSGLMQLDIVRKKRIKIQNQNDFNLTGLQLAPNGSILLTVYDSKKLLIIKSPNLKGNLCNINLKNDFFANKGFTLPTFNQSYFYTPAINYTYQMECINNSVQFWGKDTFGANSHNWQVRKQPSAWQNISSNKNHTYTFTDTGKYDVRYIADNGSRKDTIVKTIIIYPKINKQFLGKDTTYVQGSTINKTLKTPQPLHCQLWQDTSDLSTYTATKKGIYTCKITNQAFCEVIDTIEIKECLSLTTPSIYHSNKGDTLFCSHSIADTFIWYRNNVPYKTTYANAFNQSQIKLSDTGTYRVEAVKYGHCNRSSATYYINKLSIVRLMTRDLGIKVYPNPSNGDVNIESENSYQLIVTDVTGRTIFQTENTKQIELPKGVYFFRFDINKTIILEKVLVL